MRFRRSEPHSPRRGVTLVEMMVSVALLVLMMTILVSVFGAATGALSGLQAFQQLDGDLRQLDMTIRQDLIGVTAKMTPPNDPSKNLGYFEYGENAFADLQGEDTDDYIRFTTKAPEGQLFTGRVWTAPASISPVPQPVFMTSQYAEIIYFLRNGNLYRRVLLIAPDRQNSVNAVWVGAGGTNTSTPPPVPPVFKPQMFGGLAVSWQGVNDLSARPAPTSVGKFPIQLNTLGDLTNRENRAFYPHFSNDFVTRNANGTVSPGGDGIPDDANPDSGGAIIGDGVPDYWPTLYSQIPTYAGGSATPLVFEPTTPTRVASTENMAFPYIYPGAYSQPDFTTGALTGSGWIHGLDPTPNPALGTPPYLEQLQRLNHSPLETGDSLPNPKAAGSPTIPPSAQTWWGFPTWKETLSASWTDPTITLVNGKGQPNGLHPITAGVALTSGANATAMAKNYLPPMSALYRVTPQLFNDNMPTPTVQATPLFASVPALWSAAWEDDLILTNVRSFDVKAYDDAYAGYVDLGWGDDLRLYPTASRPATPAYLTATPLVTTWTTGSFDTVAQTFAHEGRMPPLTADQRLDANYPYSFAFYASGSLPYPSPKYSSYTGNIGDNQASVMRLRRVWDSWSTDYTQAPANGFDPTTKLPVGPPWSPPVYPSYPAPYPAPLRGIQIQIRITDPRGERVKTLTIRQDFSDKL